MATDVPEMPAGAAIRTVLRHRRTVGLGMRLLAVVAFLAVITGLGQAALLIVIVRTATALTAGTESISGAVGPISATDLSVGELLLIGFAVLLVLFVAETLLSYTQAVLQTQALRTSRRRILATFNRASYPAQVELDRGDLQQVMLGHTQQSAVVCAQFAHGVVSALNFAVLVVSALVVSPIAGVVVVAGMVVILAVMRPLLAVTRRAARTTTLAQRGLSRSLLHRLELIREIRSFGVDDQAAAESRRGIDAMATSIRRQRFLSRINSSMYRLGAMALVLVMLAVIDARGSTNLAALTGALLMLLRALSYGQRAQATYQAVNEIIPAVTQLVEETERLQATAAPDRSSRTPEHVGDVRFDEVSFGYPGDESVLHGISFDIADGDFVAIVGPSGAGKSTIMALLLRLWEPTDGRVLASGVDTREIDPAWWRRRVAYVPQDPRLSAGNVTEAIRFYRDWITDEEIRQAAAMAHIADEIESWPNGYDTEVGQLGDQLSGGQRQRLALARALAGSPELLLLDEPTSALDSTSEALIGRSLDELRGTTTVVVIAHRFRTVERANRLVHVRDGRIVPTGETDDDQIRRVLEA